jgi:DNA-binding transcriptional MerR regulator
MAEYKIKDLESLTGIKAHTIRIWEKRYNLLSPCRTETNLRTYTDEDLITILVVSVLNNHGMKISHIADMSHQERVSRFERIQSESVDSGAIEQFILALLNLDEKLFCETFQDLVDTHGLELTFSDFVVPFLDRIGVMWLVGTINPAQEHFMSHLIRQKIIVAIAVKQKIGVNMNKHLNLIRQEIVKQDGVDDEALKLWKDIYRMVENYQSIYGDWEEEE